jgi:hypothetical protein
VNYALNNPTYLILPPRAFPYPEKFSIPCAKNYIILDDAREPGYFKKKKMWVDEHRGVIEEDGRLAEEEKEEVERGPEDERQVPFFFTRVLPLLRSSSILGSLVLRISPCPPCSSSSSSSLVLLSLLPS